MMVTDLSSIDEIYSCAVNAKLVEIPVADPKFNQVCRSYYLLRRELNDHNRDHFWIQCLKYVSRLIRRHMSFPYPFDDSESRELVENFKNASRGFELSYPSYTGLLSSLQDNLTILVSEQYNPMYEKFVDRLNTITGNQTIGILLYSRASKTEAMSNPFLRLNLPTNLHEKLVLLEPNDVTGSKCYENLVLFGHYNLYSKAEFVFSAPRANNIHLFSYEWIRNQYQPAGSFLGSESSGNIAVPLVSNNIWQPLPGDCVLPDDSDTSDMQIMEFDDILPRLDITSVLKRLDGYSDESHTEIYGYDEEVQARLIELDTGSGVLIPVKDGGSPGKYPVMDVTEFRPRMLLKSVDGMSEGDFLMLRTVGGGGDYLDHFADQMLKEIDKLGTREVQQEWKRRLQEMVEAQGTDKVARLLSELGCGVANAANIRYWMSKRSLATKDPKDFEILLSYLGFSDRVSEIREAMAVIRNAIHRSGVYLRSRIMDQISDLQSSDFSNVISKDFMLGTDESGVLTAFSIADIHDEIFTVKSSSTLKPIEIE